MITSVALLLAGIMGAAGIGLAAMAAHSASAANLATASHMLMFHAVAVMAATALLEALRPGPALVVRYLAQAALLGWVIGASVFAADIAMRAFAGERLFAMAAPIGGTLLIAAWLVFAGAAAWRALGAR